MERTLLSLTDTINTLAQEKKYATLKDILETMNPVDIAEMFEDIPEDKIQILFRLLQKELTADKFVEMNQ